MAEIFNVVEYAVDKGSVKENMPAVQKEGSTLLHKATIGKDVKGQEEMAKSAVKSAVKMVNIIQKMATYSDEETLVSLLRAEDCQGKTPLHYAVDAGNIRVVEELLSIDVGVNQGLLRRLLSHSKQTVLEKKRRSWHMSGEGETVKRSHATDIDTILRTYHAKLQSPKEDMEQVTQECIE